MAQQKEIIIGDFFPQPASGSRVFLSVYADHPIRGTYSVIGEAGKEKMREAFCLVAEGDALEIPVTELPKGAYQVTLQIDGRKWFRPLFVGDKSISKIFP